jgi:cyclopropane-fatty-acyl-phospholipid synthase
MEGGTMSTQTVKSNNQIASTSLSFLKNLLADYHPRNFAVRLWDGNTLEAEPGQPTRFTLVIQHPGAIRKMLWPPNELTLAEAYIYDDFDIEGDLEGVFEFAELLNERQRGVVERLSLLKQVLDLPSEGRPRLGRQAAELSGALHSIERDRKAVNYHYNVSNDFFALWLDKQMVYTCAYFTSSDDDLETAQKRKLDYICRKLRLQPDERLLDIGCGWGGLIMHAARKYGTRAVGITLSQPQAELANERISRAGLTERCRVEVCDYREIDEPGGYDKLVSVGMVEHVGESMLPEYFSRAWRLLRPRGVFLNQGIARAYSPARRREPSFSDRYIFPDGELVTLSTALRAAEMSGFEVRDVESLREHYVLTLRHWRRRLEAHHDEVFRETDEATYRVWRLMCASAYRFQTGRYNLYQTLLARAEKGETGLRLTRSDWYE